MIPYVTGLRAVAIVLIVLYEVVKHAPAALLPNALVHRAAIDGLHGFELLLVISGFALAYPTLKSLRESGAASLDLRSFAMRRNVRILPAYFTALALTVFLPYAASRYGLTALDQPAQLPSVANVLTQVFFIQNHFQNDAFWALAVQVRTFALFPLVFAAYIRWRWAFALLLLGAGAADLYTAAHVLDVGAFVPFMLGMVAADLRVWPWRWTGAIALPVCLASIFGAFSTDALIATLPGARMATSIETWNPLWAIAAFSFFVTCGALRPFERLLSLRPILWLGAASFGTALVAEPVVDYLLTKATPTLGLQNAALNAFAVAIACGLAFWLVVDRRFQDRASRDAVIEWGSAVLARMREAFFSRKVTFQIARHGETIEASDEPAADAVGFGDVAMLIKRSGSVADLAADINATRAHFAERGNFDPFYFEPRRVVATIANLRVEDIPAPPRTIHLQLGPTI